jgi:predicted phage tail protein
MEKKHRLVDLHYETNTFTTQDGREIHFKNVTRMAINVKVEQEQEVQALVDSFKGELSKKKEQVKEEEVDTKKTEIEEEFNEEELDFGDADIPF